MKQRCHSKINKSLPYGDTICLMEMRHHTRREKAFLNHWEAKPVPPERYGRGIREPE